MSQREHAPRTPPIPRRSWPGYDQHWFFYGRRFRLYIQRHIHCKSTNQVLLLCETHSLHKYIGNVDLLLLTCYFLSSVLLSLWWTVIIIAKICCSAAIITFFVLVILIDAPRTGQRLVRRGEGERMSDYPHGLIEPLVKPGFEFTHWCRYVVPVYVFQYLHGINRSHLSAPPSRILSTIPTMDIKRLQITIFAQIHL